MLTFKYELPKFVDDVAEINKELFLQKANTITKKEKIKDTIYKKYIKRGLDIILSFIALVISLPINVIIAIITFIDIGSPLFFSQERFGKNGKKFSIIKFRNMSNKTDINGKLLPAGERVTKIGKVMRKTSLDELLNFVSVFKGDMSIIGPRPLPIEYENWMSNRHLQRSTVRPGLECPSILTDQKYLDWDERFENDVLYAKNCSFVLDIKLCFKIIKLVLFPAKGREKGDRGFFVGYNEEGKAIGWEDLPQKTIDECKNRDISLN